MKNLLLASTSTVHGSDPLSYLFSELKIHFKGCKSVLFIPFARPEGLSHDEYTAKVSDVFSKIDMEVIGLHSYTDMTTALNEAEAIFTGGGNTFVLLDQLYKNELIKPLQKVLNSGTPYLGTSAGTNICGQTVGTTNDMPIIYPPSFEALKLIPFNINPHYLDPDPNSTHMGETRETRINEFHKFNSLHVLGLREGSFLKVHGNRIQLLGPHEARLFRQKEKAIEIKPSSYYPFT